MLPEQHHMFSIQKNNEMNDILNKRYEEFITDSYVDRVLLEKKWKNEFENAYDTELRICDTCGLRTDHKMSQIIIAQYCRCK